MDVFKLHQDVIQDYASYIQSFIKISDPKIKDRVQNEIEKGLLWPEPLLQLNPSFEPGRWIDELVGENVLHEECARIFRAKSETDHIGKRFRLHKHQDTAIETYLRNEPYVLTTGTGSGKSLSYIVPAVDHVLKNGSGRGLQAIIVYPMNALANSQREELDKFLKVGMTDSEPLVTYARYTGQETSEEREQILQNPPDILLTNYVMLELILTRVGERRLVGAASNLRFLVFDELHTYRGRQGADVSMLIRRCRDAFRSNELHCVGTSATMESKGSSDDQARVVAKVATKIFGEDVPFENIIGETLRRTTLELDCETSEGNSLLAKSFAEEDPAKMDFQDFQRSPMAAWIESSFGLVREEETGKLVRQTPTAIGGPKGAGATLAEAIDVDLKAAVKKIEEFLAGGESARNPETGFNLFAFRLHQFISRGDTPWTTLEAEDARPIFLRGQQFVPGDRTKILLPLVFCRQCGQEYYRVDIPRDFEDGSAITARENYRTSSDEEFKSAFLYVSKENPWPIGDEQVLERLPSDWIEDHNGRRRVKPKQPVPETLHVGTDGRIDKDGVRVAAVKAPFRFCLNPNCGVAYNARQRSDAVKLSTLGVDGRSTATTILALTTLLKLRLDTDLPEEAKKLLSFTDNRQDASLQSGHFNDFVLLGLLRSALYRAVSRCTDTQGLRYDDLVETVRKEMNLPVHFYSNDEDLRGPALDETKRALRSVLRHYLYRDLERNWRVTSPNLEQTGLLRIEYNGLDDCAADQKFWENPPKKQDSESPHPLLATATAEQRKRIIKVLLDHLRRSLAIKDDSLNRQAQEKIYDQSRQRLCEPWVIEDLKEMTAGVVAWPGSRQAGTRSYDDISISPQSSFGLFLSRAGVLPETPGKLSLEERGVIIRDIFRCIKQWGLVAEVAGGKSDVIAGYQIPSSVFLWKMGDGSGEPVDELRIVQASDEEQKGNDYFRELYKSFVEIGNGLEAKEHTAQVPSYVRQEREISFRKAELPLLFCSPTMELGVDISQLNVVNMRNVPPTPANYAQRSGRAGRSGQAALVYTYCSGFSPHDQYYFRNPTRMVSGRVTSPRIDLLNRDLIKSHIHAVWLSEAGIDLGKTLSENVLNVSEDELELPLKEGIRSKLTDDAIKTATYEKAKHLIEDMVPDIKSALWYREEWLEDTVKSIPTAFDQACERWRSLYRSAVQQRKYHNKIIGDHSKDSVDRDKSKRLRGQAESQISLLTDPQNVMQGDFYSYRYFASEGFLPGYNFPRLPLSAFIPGRRWRQGRDEYLSRARFLAITEFGPRAVIYHEGARYRVNKVNLQYAGDSDQIAESAMKICSQCGYGHYVTEGGTQVDNCESCGVQIHPTDEVRSLIRLQNVTVKKTSKISSDEEERQRIGYQIDNSFQFSTVNGELDCRLSEIKKGDSLVGTMRYGDSTTIWRINRGWRQRTNEHEAAGFLLDVERGYWATNKDLDDGDSDDPLSKNIRRVVPFVEDVRNALTFELGSSVNLETMATLQAAIKQSIQKIYQLESNELAVEPLPSRDERNLLLFYEASEGGAGVLRQIAEERDAIAEIAKTAMELCHFDEKSGQDIAESLDGIECEAGCYDCLLDYGNQFDHQLIDRHLILPVLRDLAWSETEISGSGKSRTDHFDELMRMCDSRLEQKWLQQVFDQQMRLPNEAQQLVEECSTRPDFSYKAGGRFAIYIDGPPHDTEDQKQKDQQITDSLEEKGYMVIRFHHEADWNAIFDKYTDLFGPRKA